MSDYIIWQHQFSVGHAGIDGRHERFIGIINEAYALSKQSVIDKRVPDLHNDLLQYTIDHFGYEKKLLAASGGRHRPRKPIRSDRLLGSE
jgi:hemerythrin